MNRILLKEHNSERGLENLKFAFAEISKIKRIEI